MATFKFQSRASEVSLVIILFVAFSPQAKFLHIPKHRYHYIYIVRGQVSHSSL